MFFILSKIFWALIRPLHLIFLGSLLALWIARRGKRRLAKNLAWLLVIAFIGGGFTQLPNVLLANLENDFERKPLPRQPAGIIVLGGAIHANPKTWSAGYETGESAERIFKALELARDHPGARIIYTGGSVQILHERQPEAVLARQLIEAVSDEAGRFEYEERSRNTHENAVFTEKMIAADKKKPWLLVTSAFHMKRSIAVFEKQGINVVAVPVDHQGTVTKFPWLTINALAQFSKLDLWIREQVGLAVYALTDRI